MLKMTNDEGWKTEWTLGDGSISAIGHSEFIGIWSSSFNQLPGVIAACCNPDSTPPPTDTARKSRPSWHDQTPSRISRERTRRPEPMPKRDLRMMALTHNAMILRHNGLVLRSRPDSWYFPQTFREAYLMGGTFCSTFCS